MKKVKSHKCDVCLRMRKLFSFGTTQDDKDFLSSVLDDLEVAETDALMWKMKYEDKWAKENKKYIRIPIE